MGLAKPLLFALATLLTLGALAGCTLITDVDRSLIPGTGGAGSGGTGGAATADGSVLDAGTDGGN
jgi:hypothetical protein